MSVDHREGEQPWAGLGYCRGMPAFVQSNVATFLAGGASLAHWPIERLSLNITPECPLQELAECPAFSSVPGLQLSSTGLGRLTSLFASPHFPALRGLWLGPETLQARGTGVLLARNERLAGLRSLDLSRCNVTTPGLASLLRSPHLRSLQRVNFRNNPFDDESAQLLAQHEPAREWSALSLAGTTIGLAGFDELLRSGTFENKESLDLDSVKPKGGAWWFGNTLVEQFLQIGLPQATRRLNIAGLQLNAYAFGLLARHEPAGRLRELNLSRNPLDTDSIRVLSESPNLAGLEELCLNSTEIDNTAAAVLAASACLRPFRVSLIHNSIGPEGARALAQSPFLSRVVELNLSHNPLRPDGVQALAGAAWLARLSVLSLEYTGLADKGLEALAASPGLAGIVRLNLSANHIGDDGALALAKSPHAVRLKYINLTYNNLTNLGAAALCERFGANAVISTGRNRGGLARTVP